MKAMRCSRFDTDCLHSISTNILATLMHTRAHTTALEAPWLHCSRLGCFLDQGVGWPLPPLLRRCTGAPRAALKMRGQSLATPPQTATLRVGVGAAGTAATGLSTPSPRELRVRWTVEGVPLRRPRSIHPPMPLLRHQHQRHPLHTYQRPRPPLPRMHPQHALHRPRCHPQRERGPAQHARGRVLGPWGLYQQQPRDPSLAQQRQAPGAHGEVPLGQGWARLGLATEWQCVSGAGTLAASRHAAVCWRCRDEHPHSHQGRCDLGAVSMTGLSASGR
jgi:hypothetical protein